MEVHVEVDLVEELSVLLKFLDLLQFVELVVGERDALEIHQDVADGDVLAFAPGKFVVSRFDELTV